jgi:DNA transformation protein
MPVSPEFQEFALEQLEQIAPVRAKRMFGGVGLYSQELFFALLDDDTVYFKVDDGNRSDYEALGLGAFDPYKDGVHLMQYYPVPAEVLEDAEQLRPWMDKALAAAQAARAKRAPRKKSQKTR